MSTHTEQRFIHGPRSEISDPCFVKGCRFRTAYFREQRIRFDLEHRMKILDTQNQSYREVMRKLMQAVDEAIMSQDEPADAFKNLVEGIPGVVRVYKFVRGDTINIWTTIEEEDFESEIGIAAAQSEILRRFTNHNLHFMVLPVKALDVQSLIPKDAKLV